MCVFAAAGYTPAVGVQQQSSHTQAQAVLRTYSPIASHQCSMVQVKTEPPPQGLVLHQPCISQPSKEAFSSSQSACVCKFFPPTLFSYSRQGGVSLSYPQSKVVTTVGGEAGYCCVVAPPSHHGSCHPPSCGSLSAPAWSAPYWRRLKGWRDDSSCVNSHTLLVNTFFSHSLTQLLPDNAHRVHHSHITSMCTHIQPLTHIYVPLYQSLIVYIAYQSCCIECIIYIHKLSFILIVNYILCSKEMHCVNRINCCGQTDDVTFP